MFKKRAAFALLLVTIPAVALAGFRVSTFKKETKLGANYWSAASALDGNPSTCWMVPADPDPTTVTDAEHPNNGQWIEVDVPTSTIDKLSIMTGWEKDENSFKDYAHIKQAKVELFGTAKDETEKVAEATFTFEDKAGWQTVDLPDTAVGGEISGGRLRVTVLDTYPGEDFPNLAVSEVLVRLKETDIGHESVKIPTPPPSVAGHDETQLNDGNAKTFFLANGPSAEFDVGTGGFGVSSIGLSAGPKTSARPKTVDITANGTTATCNFTDKPEMQFCEVPTFIGYTGSYWGTITVSVRETWPGSTDQNVGITDMTVRYTNFELL